MKASVSLRSEVTSKDVSRLKQWTGDRAVMQYMNEESNISGALASLLSQGEMPTYTPLFNRSGRFFMIDEEEDGAPVGYVRLVNRQKETEIVLAIGEKELWGNGLGGAAIHNSLKKAFFEWRADKVVAHIHPRNDRSARAFVRSGFSKSQELPNTRRFEITMDEYLQSLRKLA